MANLSKEEKKALIQKWKEAESNAYLLSKANTEALFSYLEEQLEESPCDHTLHFTKQWLANHLPEAETEDVLAEMEEMGGYCDCEVLANCYEDYDI